MSDFSQRVSQLSPAKLALLVTELHAKLEAAERSRSEPIAVVGMACRFPGGCTTPAEFWRLLREGRDAIVEVPPDRWDVAHYFDSNREAPGRMYTRHGGFLADVAGFDAKFFGISPREAISLDPQHRLLLEVGWEALENAGWAPGSLVGSSTGVFVGITASDYAKRLDHAGDEGIDAYRLTGNPLNFAAGRLAYTLGLQGPTLAVDTACSSSLVSVHLACQSLRNGECGSALAAGVNLILMPQNTITTCKAQMLSADGRCKTFDDSADGIGRAEGCGVVVLKRLSAALADRDHIHAVIRSSAVNQDGRSSGLTVPNGLAQQSLIRAALAQAGLAPRDVTYLEAHGTGTSLGDPIELEALAGVFGGDRDAGRPLWVGSVKTNIGHTESAAGVAGLIKVVLALQHQTIPAHLHFQKPTSRFSWQNHPLRVPRTSEPWPRTGARIAGISSFGGSGTNAHLILAGFEAPSTVATNEPGPPVLTLSAKTESALRELGHRYAEALAEVPPAALADACYTTNVGRSHFRHRLALVADNLPELRARLQLFAANTPVPHAHLGAAEPGKPPRVAFIFTGQGAQYARMGQELYPLFPAYRNALDRCAALLATHLDRPLLELLQPLGQEDLLRETAYTQPVMFAVEYALAELWRSWGIEPAFVLGHSLGEYVAACIAGVFSLEDALKLVAARARLMQALPAGGAMVAVFADEARVTALVAGQADRVAIAAVNGPENTVLSGDARSVHELCDRLERQGIRHRELHVSHAFHSPLMDPMLPAFAKAAGEVAYHQPRLSLASNVTGRLAAGAEIARPEYWVEHVRRPVRFADGMRTLAQQGVQWMIEIGPQPVLSGMAAEYLGPGVTFLPSLVRGRPDGATMADSVARLYAAGAEVAWPEFHRGHERHRMVLPTYPFEHQRFWVDVAGGPAAPLVPAVPGHPLLGRRVASPLPAVQFTNAVSAGDLPWLGDHRVLGRLLFPAAAYIEMAWAAARQEFGREATALVDLVIGQALVIPEAGPRSLQLVLQPAGANGAGFDIFSLDAAEPDGAWTRHASGRLDFAAPAPTGTEGFASVHARCTVTVEPELLYRRLRQHGFTFGPGFQTLAEIRRSENEALVRVGLAGSLRHTPGPYRIHPTVLDGCLQAFAVAARDEGDGAGSPIYLPLSIERLELSANPPGEIWSHARFRPGATAGTDTLVGDADLYDAQGRPVGRLRGFHLKRVDPAKLGLRAKEPWRDWIYSLRWQEEPRRDSGPADLPDLAGVADAVSGTIAAEYDSFGLTEYNEILPELNKLCVDYILEALAPAGEAPGSGRSLTLAEVLAGYRILPSFAALTERLLNILVEDGLLAKKNGRWDGLRELPAGQSRQRAARLRERHAILGAELDMLARCGGGLGAALQGRADPLQLLFPEGGLSTAEKVYGASPYARFYARVAGNTVARLVDGLPKTARLRVLEIGGGTGGTTAAVLPLLAADRTAYTFTDISAQFTKNARRKFQDFPFVDYRLLDIGKDPLTQGFPAAQFDLIIAANVLHATSDLRQTIGFVRTLLRPEGVLVLLETVRPQRFGDLTVGLTGGWWMFTDRELRPDYPLLGQARWRQVLQEQGFSQVSIVPEAAPPADRVGLLAQQAVIMGRGPARSEAPAQTKAARPDRWLVLADGQGVGAQLCATLGSAGADCVLAEPPGTSNNTAPAAGQMTGDGVADFERLLGAVGAVRPITGVVYLWGAEMADGSEATVPALRAAVRHAGAGLLHLVQALLRSGQAPRLWVCTRGAQAAAPGQASVNAGAATLWGLCRVIALEHPEFACTRIDLDPARPDREAALLAACLLEPDAEDQFALRGDRRWLPRLERFVAGAEAAPDIPGQPRWNGSFDAEGSYLITGGLGGLGLLVAQWMVERGARHLVLMARSGPDEFAEGAIAALRAQQASVQVAAGDVSEPSAVARTLAGIAEGGRPLRGVFHAAGQLDDGALIAQSWDRFERVMNAKVIGTWNLHQQTRGLPLDHFVLFSSATGLLGSPGQGNHAAANAYLDALAHWRRQQGLPAISIDWGAWSRVGAAARRQVGERVAGHGIGVIAPEEGLGALDFLLRQNPAQAAVIPIDWRRFLDAFAGKTVPAFLRNRIEPAVDRTGESRGGVRAESFQREWEAAPKGRRAALVQGLVQEEVARVLGLRAGEQVELRQPLTEFGLDSLMAVELRNSLGLILRRTLPATILFDRPTVDALTDHLVAELTRAEAGQDPATATTAGAPPPTRLDDLSERELAALLSKKLATLSEDASPHE